MLAQTGDVHIEIIMSNTSGGKDQFWNEQASELKAHTAHLDDQFLNEATLAEVIEVAPISFKGMDKATQQMIIATARALG